ncbi:MAG TPA: serine hydrolase [Flavobacteriales bacterium]|nr:serine hydrolase [Flavobacteriales bacterium]
MQLIRIAPITLLLLLTSGCTVGRFVVWNFADRRDYKKFPSRPLPASAQPFRYAEAAMEVGPKAISEGDKSVPFDAWIADHKTVAFLIIRHDTILYERYFKGYDAGHVHPSFSMAKSVVSMLIGTAIADGLIRDVQQPVTDYIPELKANGFDAVTIEHVLQMTSGIDFQESYVNPFGTVAKFYYGRQLTKYTTKLELKNPPGSKWEYVSGDTQLLGLVLERALRAKGDQRTVTQYLSDRIWTPLGMEHASTWSIDHKGDGIEKAFCCINAPARDFAKLGSLYLKKGAWRGEQIVPQEWVSTSTKAVTTNGGASFYRYQWWLPSGEGDFTAEGILGQFIYVDPSRELVMVRLGGAYGGVDWQNVFRSLAPFYGKVN